MNDRYKVRQDARQPGEIWDDVVLAWAVMADKFDMQELCGHCERAMVMYWDCFHDKFDLVGQLSSSALQRIAMGLQKTLLESTLHPYASHATKFSF